MSNQRIGHSFRALIGALLAVTLSARADVTIDASTFTVGATAGGESVVSNWIGAPFTVTAPVYVGANGAATGKGDNTVSISNFVITATASSFVGFGSSNNLLTLTDTFWDNAGLNITVGAGSSTGNVLVLNGTAVSNSTWVVGGSAGFGNSLILQNGASLVWTGTANNTAIGFGNGKSNIITVTSASIISNASTLTFGGSFNTLSIIDDGTVYSGGFFNLAGTDNSALVSGSNAVLRTGSNGFETRGTRASMVVSNGGSVFGGLNLAGADNQVLVTGTGTVWTGAVSIGFVAGANNNTVAVSAGGRIVGGLTMGGANSTGNYLVITNGGFFVDTNGGNIGRNTTGGSNILHVTGTGSVFSNLSGDFRLGNGPNVGNGFIIDSAGTFISPAGINVGFDSQSSNNFLTIDGATFSNGFVTIGGFGGGGSFGTGPSSFNRMTVTNAQVWTTSLTVGDRSATNTTTVNANTTWNVQNGNVTIGSGSATGNVLTINGGATVTNVNTISVGTSALSVGNQLNLNGGELWATTLRTTNAGNVVNFPVGLLSVKNLAISNGLAFTVGDGTQAAVLNELGGTFDLADGLVLANNGTLTGWGTNRSPVAFINTTGTVVATGGTLLFTNSSGSAVAFGNGATLTAVTGGTLSFVGQTGPAILTNFGTINLLGGTVASGPLTNLASGLVRGSGTLTGVLYNQGTIEVTNGTLRFWGNLTNQGVVNIRSDGTASFVNGGGTFIFTNASGGTVNLHGGTIVDKEFVNQGKFNTYGGLISNGLVNAGYLNVVSGVTTATPDLNNLVGGVISNTAILQVGSTGTGVGQNAGIFVLNNGTFQSGAFTNTGTLQLAASGRGTIRGAGPLVNEGVIALAGGQTLTFAGVTLTNAATGYLLGNGGSLVMSNASFWNVSTAATSWEFGGGSTLLFTNNSISLGAFLLSANSVNKGFNSFAYTNQNFFLSELTVAGGSLTLTNVEATGLLNRNAIYVSDLNISNSATLFLNGATIYFAGGTNFASGVTIDYTGGGAIIQLQALATPITWISNGDSNNWMVAANWDLNQLPATVDLVYLTNATLPTATILTNSAVTRVATLTIGNDNGARQILLLSNSTLAVSGLTQVGSNGVVQIGAGNATAAFTNSTFTLTSGGQIVMTNGAATGINRLVVTNDFSNEANTTITMAGAAGKTNLIVLSQGAFTNLGSIVSRGGTNLLRVAAAVNAGTNSLQGGILSYQNTGGSAIPLQNTGTILLNGGGLQASTVTNASGGAILGSSGSGTLNAALVNQVGGIVSNAGATWTITGTFDNLGTFVVINGGLVTNLGAVTVNTSTAVVTGAGSRWVTRSTLAIGTTGAAGLSVTNGGRLTSTGAAIIGNGLANNLATVADGGAVWDASAGITVGTGNATGNVLNVNSGGTVLANGLTISATADASNNIVTVAGGSLFVTNAAGNAVLNVGAAGRGTLTLSGGSLYVNQLLVTNNIAGGATNSFFNFTGGTLTTSNAANRVAANIVIPSNSNFNINNTWNMRGGTNIISGLVATNGGLSTVFIGNGVSNAAVNVGAGAVWSLNTPGGAGAYSNLNLTIGTGAATGNVLTINGGLVNNVSTLTVGGTSGNGVLVTGGGALINDFAGVGNRTTLFMSGTSNYISLLGGTLTNAGTINVGGTYNTITVGSHSTFTAQGRFTFGGTSNLVLVTGANSLFSHTGGLTDFVLGGSQNMMILSNGGTANGTYELVGGNAQLIVTGNGSVFNATLAIGGLTVGAPASTSTVIITSGGLLQGSVRWGAQPSSQNLLIVTNGGRAAVSISHIGRDTTGASNMLIVTGTGSVFSNSGGATVGNGPNVGNGIIINAGAAYYGAAGLVFGNSSQSSNNFLTITDAVFSNAGVTIGGFGIGGSFGVGPSSFNAMTVTNSQVWTTGLLIGDRSASNTATAYADTTWNLANGDVTIGSGSATGNTLTVNSGANLLNAARVLVGTTVNSLDNSVLIQGGLLEANTLSNFFGSTGSTISNVAGTYQFTAAPTIGNNGFGNIALTDGTISFRATNAANVTNDAANQIRNIAFAGANTFMLNNASNTAATVSQTYTFDTIAGNPSNYVQLVMVNGQTAYGNAAGADITIGTAGSMLISNTTAIVSGLFTNTGSLNFVNAKATFQDRVYNSGTNTMLNSVGTFNSGVINAGHWLTDPTTNVFANFGLTNTISGVINMAAGDVYVFTNTLAGTPANFVNVSTNNAASDLRAGKLLFNGGLGLTQTLTVAGHDLGPAAATSTNLTTAFSSVPGFASNFALGTLEISNFSTVRVTDAFAGVAGLGSNDFLTAGLYLENLYLGPNSLLIIDPGVQVYFKNSNNWSLANIRLVDNQASLFVGDTYDYNNSISGLHQLTVIPEPSVLVLVLGGLLTMYFSRRRRQLRGR